MAIKDVESKCWILALFVRDDGERFLLGDGKYEFTEDQMHFAANVMANDVVEVQGNDGYMLAGQVRRPDTQSFDGYIGDSSTSKTEVEACRQAFFKFFRKNYFYKVIYIFSDGSAIQRKRGFLVDAPEAKELYQIYPKYHVALNFEDINYYYYDENADGDEIYGKSATISLNSAAQTGGLVWIEPGKTTISEEGTDFTVTGTVAGGVLWEDNGAVWEEGKPAYSTITIDSIDNVYPVVTITGRTVNPIITDVTTGMAFQYSGTITESQILTIDMLNKTATLNGTSVIGNVTGDWLYLAPGANRITYTADNATAPNATIEWQEIVG